uniref:Uncharacterized protein n=1 Tax=Amphimedon queenslandica TaxID=400682 RepID=A0A1X7VT30_AMPQE
MQTDIDQLLELDTVKNLKKSRLADRVMDKPGIFRDFSDGFIYNNHPVLREHPDALQIVGYYDELEVCNPLGSNV